VFKHAGYEVVSALGLAEAQHLCRRESFDLVIIGHAIPRPDKLSLARLSHDACSAPVLALVRPGEEPFEEADAVIEVTEDEAVLLGTIRRLLI
jgi:DNA-binding response OmpR family regulator